MFRDRLLLSGRLKGWDWSTWLDIATGYPGSITAATDKTHISSSSVNDSFFPVSQPTQVHPQTAQSNMVGQFCLKDLQIPLLYNSCWTVFSNMTTGHCTLNPNSGLEKGQFAFVNALILPMRIPFWKFNLAIFCFFILILVRFPFIQADFH